MKFSLTNLLSRSALALSLSLTHSLHAATVTSCDEAGLRAAIATGGPVSFACDGVITLTNTIAVTNNLVLDGSDRIVAISGSSMVRIFNVETGAVLTINNLELRDGLAMGGLSQGAGAGQMLYDGVGGAIANTGTVWAVNCRFTSNLANGRRGGPVDQFGGSPLPTSGCGGAVFNAGNLILTNCTFSGNQATGGDGYMYLGPSAGGAGLGGAVFNAGSATISRCVLLKNTASGGKGGDGPSAISYPVGGAGGGTGAGGSIFSQGLMIVVETLFEESDCRGGVGGIGSSSRFGESGGSGGDGGAAQGGAIYCTVTNAVVMKCTFFHNRVESGDGGDGVAGYGSQSGISGNGGNGGSGGNTSGAAIHVESGEFSATNATLYDNTAIGGNGGNAGNGGSCTGSGRGIGGNGGNGGTGGPILGAGIHTHAASASIVHCTIADNRGFPGIRGNAGGAGGSCHFAENGLPGLPGKDGTNHANNLYSDSVPVSIRNSILTTTGFGNGCNGYIFDAGYNLSSENNSAFNAPTSMVGVDPSLSSLTNNGGPTPTMTLLANSHAIDAGECVSGPAIDQRGVSRPLGAACDIGAVEYDGSLVPLVIATVMLPEVVHTGRAFKLQVQLSNPNTSLVSNISFAISIPTELAVGGVTASNSCASGTVEVLSPENVAAGSEFVLAAQSECIVDLEIQCLVPGVWKPALLTISTPSMGVRYSSAIGAVRVIAEPTALTAGISNPLTNAFTLNARVNPNGATTLAWFEWGTTIALSDATAPTAMGDGFASLPLSATLTGLPANTVFYYRIVSTNSEGLVRGSMREGFTTGGMVVLCADENLRANLAAGGRVTFGCDGTVVLSDTLEITRDTILDGSDRTMTISGDDKVRVFLVRSGANLTLLNLTISDGRSTNGGACYNEPGGIVHMNGCRIVGNSAIGQSGASGTNGADGEFGNISTGGTEGQPGGLGLPGTDSYGGAIFNGGIFKAIGSSFLSNQVSGGYGGDGGNGGRGGYGRSSGKGGAGGDGGRGFGGAIYSTGIASLTNVTLAWNGSLGGNGGKGGDAGPGDFFRGPAGVGGKGGDAEGGATSNAGTNNMQNATLTLNHAFGGNGGLGGRAYNSDCPRAISGSGGNASGGALANTGALVVIHGTLWNNSTLAGQGTNFCADSPQSTNGIAQGSAIKSILIRAPRLGSTIVGGTASVKAIQGPIVDLGYNLSSDNTPNFSTQTSRKNTDPLLGPLADNGGPTLTMAPLPGSPAIDADNDLSAPATDQRAVPRPQGAHADIGAMEATFLRIERLVDGNVRLRYAGIPGENYTLEGTLDLNQPWSSIETKPAGPNGSLQYLDLPASPAEQMFRVKPP